METSRGFKLNYIDKNTIKGQIGSVQVDMITYGYPLIKDLSVDTAIRMASLEDIAAMKLNAIVGNGTRLKDFIDIAFLSSYLSLEEMIQAYEEKYEMRNPMMTIKSLGYHKEINFKEPILFLKGTYSWPVIEERINQMIKSQKKLFPSLPLA